MCLVGCYVGRILVPTLTALSLLRDLSLTGMTVLHWYDVLDGRMWSVWCRTTFCSDKCWTSDVGVTFHGVPNISRTFSEVLKYLGDILCGHMWSIQCLSGHWCDIINITFSRELTTCHHSMPAVLMFLLKGVGERSVSKSFGSLFCTTFRFHRDITGSL